MAMNARTPVLTGLTWKEFLDLPEEYHHASLIDGEPYVTAPSFRRNDYPTVGVSELWLVDPREPSAQVIRFGAAQETVLELDASDELTSPLLPGFSVTLRDLVDRRSSRRVPR
jgi:Uma2 family endonuclease